MGRRPCLEGGRQIFALASKWGQSDSHFKIGFKASDMAFRMLIEQGNIQPSPYLGRYKWVQLQTEDALSNDDTRAYIAKAHELVVAKLTRAKRRELDL